MVELVQKSKQAEAGNMHRQSREELVSSHTIVQREAGGKCSSGNDVTRLLGFGLECELWDEGDYKGLYDWSSVG